MMKTKLISAMSVGLFVAVACSFMPVTKKANPQRAPLAESSRPWNGGKPTAPIEIMSDVTGPIRANEDHPVNLFIRIDQPCSEVKMRARGIDGLVLVSGHQPTSLGACQPGDELSHQVVVRLPSGGIGLLVIDLVLENLGDGSTPGGRQSYTKAISIEAEGARNQSGVSGKASESKALESGGFVEIGNSSNVR